MSDLESIVRPFQSSDPVASRPFYEFNQQGVPNLHLQFGRSGSGKTMSGNFSARETVYCKQYSVETKDPSA